MTDTETVDLPSVGPVNKRVLAGVVAGVGGFVGYRYWVAKRADKAAATADATAAVDPAASDFANAGTTPSVIGAVSPTNSYGSNTGATTGIPAGDAGSYGFHGVTNDQWTQYAATQLQQSDQWSYTDIVTALGLYLAQKPTTNAQQQIISSAIAVAGHPPVGSFVLITAATPVAVTPVTTPVTTPVVTKLAAPGKPTVSHITKSSATISWPPVTGAVTYILSTDGKEHHVAGTSTNVTGYGTPGKTYNAHVKAVDAKGTSGPWSANTSFVTAKK